jgi:hypothetical protein
MTSTRLHAHVRRNGAGEPAPHFVPRPVRQGLAIVALFAGMLTVATTAQQMVYSSGQTVAPAFEGWEKNPDGSYNMVFGYFNRNLDEHVYVPVGPNNSIEPGGPDKGQPTYFFPRRNRFHFKVRVPADFGKKELVWTLTTKGQTEKAYATLIPEYIIDNQLSMLDVGNFGRDPEGRDLSNKAPTVQLQGPPERQVAVGKPLSLTANASDDGMPKAKPAPVGRPGGPRGRANALGLRVAWFVYRGDGANVTFDPPQFKIYPDYRTNGNSPWTPLWAPPPLPPNGEFPVTVTFKAAGTYTIRVVAHDGGLSDTRDVTVKVTQ